MFTGPWTHKELVIWTDAGAGFGFDVGSGLVFLFYSLIISLSKPVRLQVSQSDVKHGDP